MSNYFIGISGLDAARKALDIIGNNIANAATDGYHRQRVELRPAYSSQEGSTLIGGGVDVAGVTRLIDVLLEKEIVRQQSSLSQVSQELATLRTVENAFGELTMEDSGLNAMIDKFFNSLQDLSVHPAGSIWQNQVVSDASAMAGQFRTLAEFLTDLETQIRLETENTIESVNALTSQIAELNDNIERLEMGGGQANNLCDQRDQLILDLSELIGVETMSRDHGVVDITVAGIPLVMGASANEFDVGLDENGDLGICIVDTSNYKVDVSGGKIGALLSLKNNIVSDIHDDLNSLANAIIQQINQCHVQAVGSSGSFTELTGWTNTSGDLSDFSTVSAGYVYIRVSNTGTGAVTRTAIPVLQDTSSDTLTEIASYITSNVANVSASVNSSNQLTITADAGYEFDFLPAVLSSPKSSTLNLNGSSPPTISVSGIYTGTENQTFTFTVSGTGEVGNGTIQITVTDGDSDTVTTVNVGSGYAAGDLIDVGNGLKISVGMGDLVTGDSFQVDAYGDTDTSGLLSAVGINTFFSGSSASDIAVCSAISATPALIATSLGADMTDNTNVVRMAQVKDQAITALNSLTCGDFYRKLVVDVGQQISVKQMNREHFEVIVKNLLDQRGDMSGVDINDEAAQLLLFEQMYQAIAKYLITIQTSMDALMQLI